MQEFKEAFEQLVGYTSEELRAIEFSDIFPKKKTNEQGSVDRVLKQNGKIVQRRKYAQNIEANRQRTENDKTTYKKRQAIVEHIFGTIKRQWGFSYIITKKYIHRASADVGFMFIAYNLRRIINILGQNVFKEYLKVLISYFFRIFDLTLSQIRHFNNKNIFNCF